MAIDGTYKTEITTPRGAAQGTLVLKTDGNSLSGTYSGVPGEVSSFEGGIVDGDRVSWSVEANTPRGAMMLGFKGTVSGDGISGEVQMGTLGSNTFKCQKQ